MLRAPASAVATALLALSISTPGQTASEQEIEEAQNLYREYCRHCHTDGSEAGKYNPTTLIQAQWIRFFDRKYERAHRKVADDAHGGAMVTDVIGAEDLAKIGYLLAGYRGRRQSVHRQQSRRGAVSGSPRTG